MKGDFGMLSQRDYYEYGTIRNMTFVVPVEGSYVDPNAGPVERAEMKRADRIDLEVVRRQKNERRNHFKED